MTLVKAIFKGISRLVGIVLLLAISLYALLWAINWQDEAPSAESLQLQQILQSQVAVPEQDNGVVYFTKTHPTALDLPEALRQLIHCLPEQCLTELKAAQAELPALLRQHQTLLDSYQTILQFPAWQYPLLEVSTKPHPISPLIEMQQLYLLDVWQKTQAGDVATAKTMLQQDLSFWRKQLVTSNNALYKLHVVSGVSRHFMFANLLKQSLPAARYQQLMPDLWLQPLTADELSLLPVMAGEWHFSNSAVESLGQFRPDVQNTLERWFTLALWRPFIKPQAVSNTFAQIYLACAQNPSAQAVVTYSWYRWLYNPIGKTFTQTWPDICRKQSKALFDLEQKRLQLTTG